MSAYQYQYSNKVGLEWVIKNMPDYLFPDLSKKKDRINKPFSGVIATLDKHPVGLLLASFDNHGNSARLHSFVVNPQHRKRGVGSAMWSTMEESLTSAGADQIDAYYRSHWKSRPFLEKILTAQDWQSPKEDLIIVKVRVENILELFVQDQLYLPDEYSFIPFLKLTIEDKEFIERQKGAENSYLDYLDPFLEYGSIYDPSSLAIKCEGRIVGWLISHLIASDLIEYTSLYIEPKHRSFKLAHLLMRQGVINQQESGISKFLITAKLENRVMGRFLKRHIEYADVVTKSLYTRKELG